MWCPGQLREHLDCDEFVLLKGHNHGPPENPDETIVEGTLEEYHLRNNTPAAGDPAVSQRKKRKVSPKTKDTQTKVPDFFAKK